jgi:hypothetical protein
VTEACERCGWIHAPTEQPQIVNWPEDIPSPPPLPALINPHPIGRCCSPFAIGDALYWDMAGANPDLPPLKVRFTELTEIGGPSYHVENDEWVLDEEPKAITAEIVVVKEDVLQEHVMLFGCALHNPFLVKIENLTPLARWPVLV